jgi:threonine dehydratase
VSTSKVRRTDIEAAATRLDGVALTSPLQRNVRLSALTGGEVYLKREDLQPVRSYKLRGAYNFIAQLDETDRSHGVVCASAGNHAQGVALACALLDTGGWAYLPRTTPRQKRDRIEALGEGRVETPTTTPARQRLSSRGRAARRWCRPSTLRRRSPGRAR